MEMYDFSAFADGSAFGSSTGSISGDTDAGMGAVTNSVGSGMGGGTNSFGSGMGDADLEQLFGQSPWGGLSSVGFTSLEQVFRGNAGGNLQRGGSASGSSPNNQGEDALLSGGDSNTSANEYSYNFSNL